LAAEVEIRTWRAVGHLVMCLSGELDLLSSPEVDRRARRRIALGHPRLVLDLSELRLCDAAAMTMLMRLSAACDTAGGWLRLAAPSGIVRRVFAIVDFGSCVPVYRTVAAAGAGDDDQRVKD
jgi:anti-sigma B factor antagonist